MTIIAGDKVYDRCTQCGKLVRLNKSVVGALHFCLTDCEKAGRHLSVRDKTKGWLRKRAWRVCESCGDGWRNP